MFSPHLLSQHGTDTNSVCTSVQSIFSGVKSRLRQTFAIAVKSRPTLPPVSAQTTERDILQVNPPEQRDTLVRSEADKEGMSEGLPSAGWQMVTLFSRGLADVGGLRRCGRAERQRSHCAACALGGSTFHVSILEQHRSPSFYRAAVWS